MNTKMCGIFGYISNKENCNIELLKQYGDKCSHRGPDSTKDLIIHSQNNTMFLQFHRLAINGLNEKSNQPMRLNIHTHITLLCNGEIYNYKELAEKYNFTLLTGSDCEIIIHLYSIMPLESLIRELDGVFSFIIYDSLKEVFIIGHDPLGVRQLYWFFNEETNELGVASEMKSLYNLNQNIKFYPPGSYTYYFIKTKQLHTYSYYTFEYPLIEDVEENKITDNIKNKLEESVKKRLITDRPFGCLLSGGLDSSIITSIVAKLVGGENVNTFAIGLKGSPDLLAAQKVADYLKTNHTNVEVSEEEMLSAIEDTIYQIESIDTTTIRASVPMFLLSKYIRDNTDIKVIFSGEGSDEASGSYLYFHNAPNPNQFQEECIRLLRDVRMFDVLRGDKTTAGAGLELRVPFFDKSFLEYYMGIDPSKKVVRDGMEKYLLRKAFENDLPEEIVWRRKDGFSDGVSSFDKPWYMIIDEYAQSKFQLSEKDLYKTLFIKHYSGCEDIIPYQWMPKWTPSNTVGDNPSGRLIV
tara:strand:- start:20314 stop:21882 length:1569 start_codon:yes stop_codon:yes gene_type:complete